MKNSYFIKSSILIMLAIGIVILIFVYKSNSEIVSHESSLSMNVNSSINTYSDEPNSIQDLEIVKSKDAGNLDDIRSLIRIDPEYFNGKMKVGWDRANKFKAEVCPNNGFLLFDELQVTYNDLRSIIESYSGNQYVEIKIASSKETIDIKEYLDDKAMPAHIIDPYFEDLLDKAIDWKILFSFFKKNGLSPLPEDVIVKRIIKNGEYYVTYHVGDRYITESYPLSEVEENSSEFERKIRLTTRSLVVNNGIINFKKTMYKYVTSNDKNTFFLSDKIDKKEIVDFLRSHAKITIELPQEYEIQKGQTAAHEIMNK